MSESVSVPAELVDELRTCLTNHVETACMCIDAARAIVYAVERATEDEQVIDRLASERNAERFAADRLRDGIRNLLAMDNLTAHDDRGRLAGESQGVASASEPPDSASTLTAPAAPPSEPLCRCGHTKDMHHRWQDDPVNCFGLVGGNGDLPCGCRQFTPPRPSISDEAEAWANWRKGRTIHPDFEAITEAAFKGGFRAGRGEEA